MRFASIVARFSIPSSQLRQIEFDECIRLIPSLRCQNPPVGFNRMNSLDTVEAVMAFGEGFGVALRFTLVTSTVQKRWRTGLHFTLQTNAQINKPPHC